MADLMESTQNPAAWLVGRYGPFAGRHFDFTDEGLRVGRTPGQNQLVLDDPEISRFHACLLLDANSDVRITDSSVNGTYINDRRIGETTLQDGDVVRFGTSGLNTFVVRLARSVNGTQHGIRGSDAQNTQARRLPTLAVSDEESTVAPPRLQLILDQYAVKDIPLTEGRIELGRTEGPGKLCIDHPSISSSHAEVVLENYNRTRLRDLGSVSGTYINGQKTNEKILEDGDLIQLGACDTHLLLFRERRRRAAALRDIELNRRITTIGRDKRNNIQLDHPTVSAFHAEIHRVGGAFQLVDKRSSNGTFVNGVRIRRQRLHSQDRIMLGAALLAFDGSQIEQQSDGTRVHLSASGLRVEVKDFKTGKPLCLLDDVSVAFDPCEFIGLLGPSGSGKSILMNALNGSRPAQQGRVLLNSANLYAQYPALRALIGYLPQEDVLHRQLTVRECLYFAARLRLPDDYANRDIRIRVKEVIAELELRERADTAIHQLSGGQRKRVSLGIELLSKPVLLFVDEPTAGQDPRTEMKMMQLFREIANHGSTVIINTHLLAAFSLLDKVAVLVRGKMAFFGPSQEMLPYFKARNPHEIYDKLQEKRPEEWAEEYRQSTVFRDNVENLLGDEATLKTKSLGATSSFATSSAKRSQTRQLSTLLSRQMALKLKDRSTMAALLVPPVVIAVLIGFMKQTTNEPMTLFMIVLVALWFGCSSAVREIVDELLIYHRERQRDLSIASYLGSKLMYLSGLAAVQSGLFLAVLILMDALENHLWEAFILMWIMTLQGGLIGLTISAVCPTAEKALYAFPLAMIPQLLLAGLLIPTVAPQHPFYPELVQPGNRLEIRPIPEKLAPIGMGKLLRYGLSPLMVARWGLEGLSDVYIHDNKEYSYPIISTVFITLHPHDGEEARAQLEMIQKKGALAAVLSESNTPTAFLSYVGILAGFAVVMLSATALALKWTET